MTDTPEEPRLPPSLRLLKGLVILLMITMIIGVITVVGLLVTRMPDANAPDAIAVMPVLPESLTLPAGTTAQAVTMGTGWIGVVSTDNQLFVFDATGKLLQQIQLKTAAP